MNEAETAQMRDNIMSALETNYHKLVDEKKRTDSELAFARRGQVVKVRARSISHYR